MTLAELATSEHNCCEGWICEQHPDQPWPHGYLVGGPNDHGCPGPGMFCREPDCQFWASGQMLPAAHGGFVLVYREGEDAADWKRRWP